MSKLLNISPSKDFMQSLKCNFCGQTEASIKHINECKYVASISDSPSKMSIEQLLIKSKQREFKRSNFQADILPERRSFQTEPNDELNKEREARRLAKVNARNFFLTSD